MPVVGPPIPGPAGDPVEPLPIEPDPGEVGFVPGRVPDALVPVPAPEPLASAGGHSACLPALFDDLPAPADTQSAPLPDAAAPCVRDVPDVPPLLVSPVDPPLLVAAGVFGSTELPVPKVLELVPEVEGVDVCAIAMPALNSSPSSKGVDRCRFIIPPKGSSAKGARNMPSVHAFLRGLRG